MIYGTGMRNISAGAVIERRSCTLSWSSHVPGDDRNAVPTGVSGVLWQGAGI